MNIYILTNSTNTISVSHTPEHLFLFCFIHSPALLSKYTSSVPAPKYTQAEAQWSEWISMFRGSSRRRWWWWRRAGKGKKKEVDGEEGALQYTFMPIFDVFHGLEVSAERGCARSPGFVYGSRLVYYKAQRQPWGDVGPRCFISCQGSLQLN